MLHESRSKYINSIYEDYNTKPKRHKLKSKSCNVPEKVLMSDGDDSRIFLETQEDIATFFNNYFTLIFTNESNTPADDPSTFDDNLPNCTTSTPLFKNIVLTPEDVANVLSSLDNDRACGPDGIPARLLTET